MNPAELEVLAQMLQRHGITHCEVQDDTQNLGVKLRFGACVALQSNRATASAAPHQPPAGSRLRSPGMGRFAACHPLLQSAAVTPGQRVEAGQTVGYLLIGARVQAITSPQAAVLGRQLVEEDALVGYGDGIFELT